MTGLLIRQYVEEAAHFAPASTENVGSRRIRVARTLLTCRLAVEILNELGVPEESDTVYRFVNVHNPRCPLGFVQAERKWSCPPVLDDHPVWGINWAGAVLICDHLGGRLASAAEWECIASNNEPTRPYPWGNAAPSRLLANYDEHYGATTPVGRLPPSDLGLYDLAGNLGEWCQDHHGRAGASFERVVKGGAWSQDARFLAIGVSRGKWERLGTTTIGLRPVWND